MSSIQERVAKGAAWLDEVRPGWRDAIDLDAFEIRDSFQCACGQTFAHEALVVRGMSGYWFALKLLQPDYTKSVGAREYGFLWDAFDDEGMQEAEVDALNAEWRRVIHSSRVPAELQASYD